MTARYAYDYPRPALTVDVVALRHGATAGALEVLLIRRGQEPFRGKWALPGGFVDEGERLEHAARRELAEECGVSSRAPLRQIGTFGDPGRDPRGWTVSVAFVLHLEPEEAYAPVAAGDDAEDCGWHPIEELPALAFDHDRVIAVALGDDTP